MTRRDKLVLAVGALALAGMSAYSGLHMRVSTDITHFLPSSDERRLAEISKRLTDSSLTRTMILSVEAPSSEQAVAAGRQLAEALRANPEVLRCLSGPDEHFAESVYALLFPHRYQLLSDQPEKDWPARLSPAGVTAAAAELKRQLTLPTAALTKRIAGADPLMAFPTLLKRLEAANAGSLKVVDGQFLAADGRHAILFLETKSSPFDGAVQTPFLDFVRAAFDRVDAAQGGTLKLEQSGLNRFAVDSERIIKADINRISSFSTIAVIVMFLLLFRSIRVLLLSFIPLIFAMAAGVAASMALFGEIHGLTLAFGSTLIGVCVDFPVHYLNHHSLEPDPGGPHGTMRRIVGALALGAITTVAGFAGLAWTSFPGMRELAVFATVGILAALASTIWLLPPLSARTPPRVRLHRAFADALGRLLEGMVRHRTRLAVLPALALLVCVIGLPRVRWSDDLSALNRIDEKLRLEDERVRAQVSRMDAGRFIIVTAPDDEQALVLNDRVNAQLAEAKQAGQLEEFSSVHSLIFSAELQQRNLAQMHADPRLAGRVTTALAAGGFRPEAFTAFGEGLAQPALAPLTLAEVLRSPLGDVVRSFHVDLGNEMGLVTLMRGVSAPSAVRERIAQIPGAYYFDQGEFLARAYGHYRERTMQLIALGVVAMFLMLFLKYRRLRPTIAAGMPALLASTATLGVLGLMGVVTNLLHVVSLLLVLSTGEDYAVFLLASARDPRGLKASAVSIVLCCVATVLGFGLLGLSEMPALQALGLTTGLGMFFSLILAPTALMLAPEGSEG
jgi:predicted exporter